MISQEGGPQPDWESDEDSRPSQRHLRKLYREARVLKVGVERERERAYSNKLSLFLSVYQMSKICS